MADSGDPGIAFVAGGSAAGAWVSIELGGMGLAFSGTAVSLGIAPLTAAGAMTGAATYGVFKAVVEGDPAALSAATLGGLAGAGISVTIGGMGLAFQGTAISLGLAPITLAGGVVGLAIYGLCKIAAGSAKESPTATFQRMDDTIFWQEAYNQALLELNIEFLDNYLYGDPLTRTFVAWEADLELAALRGEMSDVSQEIAQQQLQALEAQVWGQSDLKFTYLKDADLRFTPLQANLQTDDKGAIAAETLYQWTAIRTLRGHTGSINALAISQDSQILVSGSDDREVKLWNLETGKWEFTFVGQAKEVHPVAISPVHGASSEKNGQTIASGSFDGKVTSWNLNTKNFLHTFRYLSFAYSHVGFVYAIAFDPSGKKLFSGGDDQVIRIWDRGTGKHIRTLKGHTDAVLAIAISLDSQYLVSGSADGTIRIWTLPQGDTVQVLAGHNSWVYAVAIHPDGQTVVSGGKDGMVKLWNLKSGDLIRTIAAHAEGIFSLAISPVCEVSLKQNSQLLATGGMRAVKLWDWETGELIQQLEGRYPVAFSPDGKTLVTGLTQHRIKIWQRELISKGFEEPFEGGAWWEVLGVEETATHVQVKTAYRHLARLYHPDLNSSLVAKSRMQAINKAYQDFLKHSVSSSW